MDGVLSKKSWNSDPNLERLLLGEKESFSVYYRIWVESVGINTIQTLRLQRRP